jgi:hypothetical protein
VIPWLAFLAVFAVFTGNLQRTTPRFPQKSWAAEGLATKITAGRAPLFLERKSRKGHERRKWWAGVGDEICMPAMILQQYFIVN